MNDNFLKHNRLNFTISILMSIGEAAFSIYIAFILKDLTDLATTKDLSGMKLFLIKLAIFIIGFIIIGVLEAVFRNRFIATSMRGFRHHYLGKIFESKLRMAYGDNTGKHISYFTNNMDSIQANYVEGLLGIISNGVLMAFGLVAMLYLSLPMALGVLLVSMLPMIGSIFMAGAVAKAEKKVSDSNQSYVELIRDVFAGYTVIKSFGAEAETMSLLDAEVETLEQSRKNKRNQTDYVQVITGTLSNISIVGTFIIGFVLVLNNMITVGTVIAFIQLLNYVLSPIDKLSNGFAKLAAGKKMIQVFSEELTEETESMDSVTLEKVSSIELKHVNFSYEEQAVLEDVNLTFERGRSYAIIGGSGSGKTTMLNLISGMLENYDGNVLLDEVEVSRLQPESRYRLFSMIQQNVMIFNSSIKDNITMWKKEFDHSSIMAAVDQAALTSLVEEKTLDYNCGENGASLSGGEKQRISVARAILQESSVILVDEGTSALDKESADIIETALSSFQDKIVISVTHKLEEKNLRTYDEIIALKHGKVVEQGSFEELMERKGYFYAMYHI